MHWTNLLPKRVYQSSWVCEMVCQQRKCHICYTNSKSVRSWNWILQQTGDTVPIEFWLSVSTVFTLLLDIIISRMSSDINNTLPLIPRLYRNDSWNLEKYCNHDDAIKWKHFPRNWPFMRWIHRPPINSPTKASDAELWCFLNLHLNKRFSKQWWGWWFEAPSRPLWRHCTVCFLFLFFW